MCKFEVAYDLSDKIERKYVIYLENNEYEEK